MSQEPKQFQLCPVCGIAMVGSKASDKSAHVDTFTCLRCDTVISMVSRHARQAESEDKE
jgi:hypothetical protein